MAVHPDFIEINLRVAAVTARTVIAGLADSTVGGLAARSQQKHLLIPEAAAAAAAVADATLHFMASFLPGSGSADAFTRATRRLLARLLQLRLVRCTEGSLSWLVAATVERRPRPTMPLALRCRHFSQQEPVCLISPYEGVAQLLLLDIATVATW